MCVCMRVCVHVCVHVYVLSCICVCMFTNALTHTYIGFRPSHRRDQKILRRCSQLPSYCIWGQLWGHSHCLLQDKVPARRCRGARGEVYCVYVCVCVLMISICKDGYTLIHTHTHAHTPSAPIGYYAVHEWAAHNVDQFSWIDVVNTVYQEAG
jgi:hypothetical protein